MVVDPTRGSPESYLNKVAKSRVKGLRHGTMQVQRGFAGKPKPVKII